MHSVLEMGLSKAYLQPIRPKYYPVGAQSVNEEA